MKYIILSLFVGVVGIAFATPVSAQIYNGYCNQPGYSYCDPNYNQPYSGYQQSTNQIPYFLSSPITTATVDEGYIYGVRAEDPNGNATTYALAQGPSGMAFNPVTHVLAWTPKTSGSYPVTVSVSDYANQPALQTFTIVVSPAKVSAAPTQISQSSGSQPASTNSSGFGFFSGSKATKELAINDIQVVSGPRNINNQVSNANCGVSVSWTTNQPSVGQVVYGTQSQPDVNSFQYEQAAVEGSSPSTVHSVPLQSCISGDEANYFRVVAYTSTGYLASAQQTILPLPVEVGGEAPATANVIQATTGTFLSKIGDFLINPAVIIFGLIAIVLIIVVRKLFAGSPTGKHEGGHTDLSASDEPMISIPHH